MWKILTHDFLFHGTQSQKWHCECLGKDQCQINLMNQNILAIENSLEKINFYWFWYFFMILSLIPFHTFILLFQIWFISYSFIITNWTSCKRLWLFRPHGILKKKTSFILIVYLKFRFKFGFSRGFTSLSRSAHF